MEHKNSITVKPHAAGRRIFYTYEVEGPWREAFNLDSISGWYATASNGEYRLTMDYDKSVEGVPASILIIPFLANVLPVAWLYDADILVDEVDLDFYNSIVDFKRGYEKMYPNESFGGRVIADRVVSNIPQKKDGTLVFFSGGVDANFTLLSHLDKRPTLATIWGSDIYLNDKRGWDLVTWQHRKIADSLGFQYEAIRSTFRFFINCDVLGVRFAKRNKENWWHGFQHGLGIISHAAPLAWLDGYEDVYISSSYSTADANITCASHPDIDAAVRFCGARVHHFDFAYGRQRKIDRIVSIAREKDLDIELRVCWQSSGGKNCCECEKCIRTIFGILAADADPVDYGFMCGPRKYQKITRKIKDREVIPSSYWSEIVDRFVQKRDKWTTVSHVTAIIESYETEVLKKHA